METTLVQSSNGCTFFFGIAWFGGYIFMTFAVWPVLLRRPVPEAKSFFTDLAQPVSKLMMVIGHSRTAAWHFAWHSVRHHSLV